MRKGSQRDYGVSLIHKNTIQVLLNCSRENTRPMSSHSIEREWLEWHQWRAVKERGPVQTGSARPLDRRPRSDIVNPEATRSSIDHPIGVPKKYRVAPSAFQARFPSIR